MASYSVSSSTFAQGTEHSGISLPANTTVSKTQIGDIMYITAGNSTTTQQYVVKYDIVNKNSTQLTNTQASTFTPDGINFLEVNQAPIYLELC